MTGARMRQDIIVVHSCVISKLINRSIAPLKYTQFQNISPYATDFIPVVCIFVETTFN